MVTTSYRYNVQIPKSPGVRSNEVRLYKSPAEVWVQLGKYVTIVKKIVFQFKQVAGIVPIRPTAERNF